LSKYIIPETRDFSQPLELFTQISNIPLMDSTKTSNLLIILVSYTLRLFMLVVTSFTVPNYIAQQELNTTTLLHNNRNV
jgi:hypothetical protein